MFEGGSRMRNMFIVGVVGVVFLGGVYIVVVFYIGMFSDGVEL